MQFIFTLKQDGKLPFVPLEEEFIMGVSKYRISTPNSACEHLWSNLHAQST
jgi:hypothetical protein